MKKIAVRGRAPTARPRIVDLRERWLVACNLKRAVVQQCIRKECVVQAATTARNRRRQLKVSLAPWNLTPWKCLCGEHVATYTWQKLVENELQTDDPLTHGRAKQERSSPAGRVVSDPHGAYDHDDAKHGDDLKIHMTLRLAASCLLTIVFRA